MIINQICLCDRVDMNIIMIIIIFRVLITDAVFIVCQVDESACCCRRCMEQGMYNCFSNKAEPCVYMVATQQGTILLKWRSQVLVMENQ